ncbi:MAG: M20 family metallopeptidase [Clostridia bacterium]|nr:M20 family metallopeptidase [Clostridia bacterium]
MDKKNISLVKEKIDNIYDEVVAIRRNLHMHPELGEEEYKTCEIIMQTLAKHEIISQKIAGNGVVATIYGNARTGKSKTIAIRADIDALPIKEETGLEFASLAEGRMHACGHDIHTGMLLGTAIVLKQMENQLKGNVKLLFQPSEETIGGAERMIKEGCLERPTVDAAIGIHIEPFLPSGTIKMINGPMNAASCEIILDVEGVSCHGAHPDKGYDPILASAAIINALQSVVSRNIDPAEGGVVTIGKINGGEATNIIPSKVHMEGIIRALSNEVRNQIKENVERVVSNTAKAYSCEAKIQLIDSYPALINDDKILSIMENVAIESFGKDMFRLVRLPSFGADDFAYFAQEVPSLYFELGVGHDDPAKNFSLHNEHMNPVEESMKTGIAMEVLGAMELIDKI